MLAEPTLLDFSIGVRKIACGSTHTVVLAGLIKNICAILKALIILIFRRWSNLGLRIFQIRSAWKPQHRKTRETYSYKYQIFRKNYRHKGSWLEHTDKGRRY